MFARYVYATQGLYLSLPGSTYRGLLNRLQANMKYAFHMLYLTATTQVNISSKKLKGFRDGLSYSTSHKSKKQGEMPLPILSPIPSIKWRI